MQAKSMADFSKALAKDSLSSLNRNWKTQKTKSTKSNVPVALIGEG